ncbi:helix-hairpin-helix domain-containing protein [Fructilactobacillus frigidiflavus]|uniref:helix-hairpin-helix domain-containing protein n=1 Tax=Fructilactobacillus frigidiflavus TaxID=3242688 RepID=UPI00375783C3
MDKYIGKVKELIEEYKYQVIFGLLICMVLTGAYCFISQSTEATTTNSLTSTKPNSAKATNKGNGQSTTNNQLHEQIFVDVKGAVLNPGVYQATRSMRGTDLIKMAGGFNEHADRNQVNLAKKVTDQEILYIPIQGEISANPVTNLGNPTDKSNNDGKTGSDTKASGDKINLNEADATKMQTINGVGQKKAEKIIDYRNQNGPFKSVDDLKNVPGFGDRTVANLKPSLSV